MIKENDIVQIIDEKHHWFPCLIIVDEIKKWGIQGYITLPTNKEEPNSDAYIRLENNKYEIVGHAVIVSK